MKEKLMVDTDIIISGGGIVGLSTAYQLLKKQKKVIVLEKEKKVGKHQSGRNSGVIHSGIYYKPGSLKAINCRKGKKLLEQFCKDNQIPVENTGKLIVATDKNEEERLQSLYERGKQNEIACKLITKKEMLEIEPNISGISAIHIPETSIVDYKKVCDCLYDKIENMGGKIICGEKVSKIDQQRKITVNNYKCEQFINCSGVYADEIAKLAGHDPKIKIIPFRGEYYTLSPEATSLVKGLIYPVPDPRFPFLGVHFTKMIDGKIECGPNAVLALGKESYYKYQIDFQELFDILSYSGFWKLSIKYWEIGFKEVLRSLFKFLYVKSLKRLIPKIKSHHLLNNRPSGIRSQVITKDGNLYDDFLIKRHGTIVHVLNTPSPAATACFAIGEQISML